MRNVFLALLVVNLAYFAWSNWFDSPHAVPANPAAGKLPTIRLAGEVTPAGAQLVSPRAPHKMALNESAETARCVSIGPFADIESSARAAAALKDKGFDLSQRAAPGEASEGYWVYVGGLKSDADVQNIIRDLVYHGVTDAHAMADGDASEHRVSVGLFTERDRADKRAKQVQKLGINAEVAEHKLPASQYWLDVTQQQDKPSVPIDELIEPGSKIGVQACPAPAAAGTATATAGVAPIPRETAPATNLP